MLHHCDDCPNISAAQYKNYKNFTNLMFHFKDFALPAEWHFFATSHGKNACDGVGGTVKRLAARASLQRPFSEQILTPRQLFEFAKSSIPGIVSFFVETQKVFDLIRILEPRFLQSITFK